MKMWGKDDAGYNTTDDIKRYKENKKTKKKERHDQAMKWMKLVQCLKSVDGCRKKIKFF